MWLTDTQSMLSLPLQLRCDKSIMKLYFDGHTGRYVQKLTVLDRNWSCLLLRRYVWTCASLALWAWRIMNLRNWRLRRRLLPDRRCHALLWSIHVSICSTVSHACDVILNCFPGLLWETYDDLYSFHPTEPTIANTTRSNRSFSSSAWRSSSDLKRRFSSSRANKKQRVRRRSS